MPVTPTYPGVYIEEVPSGVRTIIGVATSITAFVGRARRGPLNEPVRIQSMGEYERTFGSLWDASMMGYAVQHYFLNGGGDALIVRVAHTADAAPGNNAAAATMALAGADGPLNLIAANPGTWGNQLRARIDHDTRPLDPGEAATSLFNLTLRDMGTATSEAFRNLSTNPAHARFVTRVLAEESTLVRVSGAVSATRPTNHADPPAGQDPFTTAGAHVVANTNGQDGIAINDNDLLGSEASQTGIYALERADLFNLLCLPPLTRELDVSAAVVLAPALTYCKRRRAVLLVDAPRNWTVSSATTGVDALNLRDENAAIYFPRVRMPDPLRENRLEEFAPCGVVAGVIARTDAERGVWKAPAGQEATVRGVREISIRLTDGENGRLNPLGINCLRVFPAAGQVVWGARTLAGADRLASEWKYLPVRRLALFIEETLYRSLQWVVFEPNDEPLWSQIRLNVGAFMQNLFRQGAFQGRSPREAYLVKCDGETTTQTDINMGVVNIVVGFAPLKPAEFVIIKIQQLAGQIEA
ncbi:MAG TPA: phage tail sheath subtilisin-like domain-containing protein [Roseiflexaceae bacterium]|nr:phage tail sheath subtilisin-like domain-containing protein [Roseiflexaceae bacterium]